MNERLSFAIAGAQKCGTSALDAYLRLHPELAFGRHKESHFFDRETGIDWRNPDYELLHSSFGAPDGRMRGEATPVTLYWTPAQYRIARYKPDMRFIVLLRDPADRAFSQWRMSRRKGWESLPFSNAIREGRLRILNDGPRSLAARRFSYVERGFYARQLTQLSEIFGWDQIMIATQAELATEPDSLLARVTDFLGVSRLEPVSVKRENISPGDEQLTNDDRAYLNELYQEDLEALRSLTGLRI
ncbi:sulfotransferase domain-containing protein [Brevundimonas vesicularis]|uniref:sulfotransferase domain-containing protein n=1 Tax=Brevundimonas vesicularis TaxID=41276 RepID=UPI0028A6C2BA|nr:sulfotransferase domain-containing protein [Brevundimonas vesicularis]